jgi:hypothetical protein
VVIFDPRFAESDAEIIEKLRDELLLQDKELKKFAWMLAESVTAEGISHMSVLYDELLKKGKL